MSDAADFRSEDRCLGAVIVAGTARCLFTDLARCPAGLPIMAVNHAALALPRIAHVASYHGRLAGLLGELRRTMAKPAGVRDLVPVEVHSTEAAVGVDRVWPKLDGAGGSSGLFAVRVALALGFTSVICAGMPLDDSGHFYDPPDVRPIMGETYLEAWVAMLPALEGRVVSCSGMTKTLLGGL